MGFEAHHFAGNSRSPKPSWARRHPKEARVEARARLAGNIIAVVRRRETDDDVAGLRGEYRFVRYMDTQNVLCKTAFSNRKERYFEISRMSGQLVAQREIVVDGRNAFWLPSQLAATELFARAKAEILETGMSDLKRQNVMFLTGGALALG